MATPPEGEDWHALHEPGCLPNCLNPAHLRWGTPKDSAAKRRKRRRN